MVFVYPSGTPNLDTPFSQQVRNLADQVRKDMDSFDRLPAHGPELAQLRNAVLFASLRWRNTQLNAAEHALQWIMLVVYVSVCAAILGTAYVSLHGKADGPVNYALAFSAGAGGAIPAGLIQFLIYQITRRREPRIDRPNVLMGDLLVPAFSLSAALPLHRATLGVNLSACVLGWLTACWISLGLGLFRLAKSVVAKQVAARHCRPYDSLLVSTVHLAAVLYRDSRWRLSAKTAYFACRHLEALALTAQRAMTAPGRAPRAVRRRLRQDGLRLAVVFRAHQEAVATAYSVAAADRIVASLLAAVEALATGDREALLAHAPQSVTVVRRIYQGLVRAWPPLVLIAAGVLLPLIPPLAEQPAVAGSLRWSLIVAGVIAFAAGQDVAGRVGGVLDKALPWGK